MISTSVFFQAEDGIRDSSVTGVQTCALPISMNNDEGGTEDEEFRVAALIDRVNTAWEVWQSTTFGCIQCHSHPYDPFRHEDYYKSMVFFNNTRDEDTEGEHPNLRTFKEEDQQKLETIRKWVRELSPQKEKNVML